MATNRIAVPKRVRFEVFKRDGFSCQYCGAHPPSVILHLDHINPVAHGGKNDIDNLITACEPCNLGKSDKLLSDVPPSLKDKAAQVKEREAQIKGYQRTMDQARSRVDDDAELVCNAYEKLNPGYTLNNQSMVSARLFVDKLGRHEVVEAMERAYSRPSRGAGSQFKYFCGICWNKIREQKDGQI